MNLVDPAAIEALLTLEDDWNGYDGENCPTQAAVDFLRCMAVVPLRSGGVQVEVHAGGFDIEIEINPDGQVDNVWLARAEEERRERR